MKALVLAAGYGTRLAPLTESTPKALVPVAGRPMIAHAIDRCVSAGCDTIVVNAHHHADQLVRHVRETEYGAPVVVSVEEVILGTGGGILAARRWLDDGEPFLVHNADIVSDIDLRGLVHAAEADHCLAALAVNTRETSRGVLFDADLRFLGKEVWFADAPASATRRFGFCGVHAIHPRIFSLGHAEGFSDIFDIYRLGLDSGLYLTARPHDGRWRDLGSVESITRYEADLRAAAHASADAPRDSHRHSTSDS